MIRFKNRKTLYFKLSLYFSALIIIICMISIGIIYFWSYHYFNNIFEDKVIEMHTSNSNQTLNIKDEWILGVTANSINLVEVIHDTPVANHIYEQAKKQLTSSQLYREEIDGKYLMYMIDIDYKNGEKVYKYSVIKDIYKEIFPQILKYFFISILFIFIPSIYIIRIICKHLSSDINQISSVANKLSHKDWDTPIEIDTNDEDLLNLVNTFDNVRKKLIERDNIQQYMLQYISHELKTPIMIISSYTQAAKEDIYPNGNLDSTLDTIIKQTNRIDRKVEQLLFITKLDKEQDNKILVKTNLNTIISRIFGNFNAIKIGTPNLKIILNVDTNINILACEDKIQVAFENIIENQLRYANKYIAIRCINTSNNVVILFYNDGDKIDYKNSSFIFNPFEKGSKGKHGLGMSISKKVFEAHNGSIVLVPTHKGCLFKVILPKLKNDNYLF